MTTCKSVAEGYAGRNILITGCTGSLGKVFLEKLLYSCPDVGNVYILLRSKKGVSIAERNRQMQDLPIFERLKKERPKDLEKVIPISGDINENNLGISMEDERVLIDEVSFVFHTAANVKFHEPLHSILNTNVKGTERVLTLCKRMKKLQILYPPPVPVHSVDELIQEQPGVDRTKQLLGDWPNTYSFSKSLGEALVSERHGNVPVIIMRPTIVTASIKEPLPGWVDNWKGATELLTAVAKGILRIIPGKGSNVLDMIPVDYVVNLMIAAAARVSSNDVVVYNIGTSCENPLTLKDIIKPVRQETYELQFNDLPWPTIKCINSESVLWVLSAFCESAPAFVGDSMLKLYGKKPRFRSVLSRIQKVRDTLAFYTTNSWKFSTKNSFVLAQSLSNADRHTFPYSPSSINWPDYLKIYIRGIKTYLLKAK